MAAASAVADRAAAAAPSNRVRLAEVCRGREAAIAPVPLLEPGMAIQSAARARRTRRAPPRARSRAAASPGPGYAWHVDDVADATSVQPLVLLTSRVGSSALSHATYFSVVVLAPAFVERHPHHDRRMIAQSVDHAFELAARSSRSRVRRRLLSPLGMSCQTSMPSRSQW